MSKGRVTLWYSTDFRSSCDGFDASAGVVYKPQSITIEISPDVEETLDIAYQIGNSSPGELFCGEQYAEQVEFLRSMGNRSLSVGDLVTIEDVGTFSCDSFGWTRLSVDEFDYDSFLDAYERKLQAECSDPECRLAH